MVKCSRCDDQKWVCEEHDDPPWNGTDSPRACPCGQAGMPCPDCNAGDRPELTTGFRVDIDDKGPRH
jgi:hypothetical protein